MEKGEREFGVDWIIFFFFSLVWGFFVGGVFLFGWFEVLLFGFWGGAC